MRIGGAVGGMEWTFLDMSDEGVYQNPHRSGYISRKARGSASGYTVSKVNDYTWNCRYLYHTPHTVWIFQYSRGVVAGCDCYDYHNYGHPYGRACSHVWNIYLHHDYKRI